jgi:hypothetical protein
MKAAELRSRVYNMLAESKRISVTVEGEVFQFVLKKRTEQDFSDMVVVLDEVYNKAFLVYMETPALKSASERKWAAFSDDDLRGTVAKMMSAEQRSLGMDLFDDLRPDEEEYKDKSEDEVEEIRNKKLEERLTEWEKKQLEELNGRSREVLLDTLTGKDAEMHGRLEQVRARADIIVSQCVYGDDDERVFPTPGDVRKVKRNGLADALRAEVSSFLESETAPAIREVIQAADFCDPTESEKPSA